jgi:hypothetical protein
MSLTSSNCYTEAGNRKYIITLKHSYASVYIFRLPGVNKRPGQPHETIGLLFFSCSLSNFILKTLVKKNSAGINSTDKAGQSDDHTLQLGIILQRNNWFISLQSQKRICAYGRN